MTTLESPGIPTVIGAVAVPPTQGASPAVQAAPKQRVVTALTGLYKPSSPEDAGALGICIFGKGGVGKTSILRTMPGRGLLLDVPQIEGGTFVLSDCADRIDVKPIYEWNDIDQVYWYLKGQKHNYDWVALDSITAMQELARRRVVKERTLDADPNITSLQEYGKMSQLLGDLLYNFRTLGLSSGAVKPIRALVIIAQERLHGEDNQPKRLGPDLTRGSLAKLIPPMLLVGHMSTMDSIDGTVMRTMRIAHNPGYWTKARAKPGVQIVPIVANPSLHVIIRHLLGNGPAPEGAVEPIITLA